MPRLIKNIIAEFIEENISIVDGFNYIESQIGLEDYVSVYNFIGYLQDFSRVIELTELPEIKYYGIIPNRNKTFIEIEISY
jgi:hypothetical protein